MTQDQSRMITLDQVIDAYTTLRLITRSPHTDAMSKIEASLMLFNLNLLGSSMGVSFDMLNVPSA